MSDRKALQVLLALAAFVAGIGVTFGWYTAMEVIDDDCQQVSESSSKSVIDGVEKASFARIVADCS